MENKADIGEIKRKFRAILISYGITDEKEIERRTQSMLNPRRDLMQFATPENRVYPTQYGFKKIQDLETDKKSSFWKMVKLLFKYRTIRIILRALSPNKHELIAKALRENKPKTLAEFYGENGIKFIKLSDGTIKGVPK